ncbi:MAG TPA: NAD(P)-dependent oxidoreductase [Pirellulales bacterium]
MRVLLTGGTGFVGSHAARALIRTGLHDVAVLVRPGADTWRIDDVLSQLTLIAGDLYRLDACRAAVKQFAPEVIVHAAWSGVLNAERNSPQQDANVQAALDCVRLAHWAGARHWIGLGSQAEYGACNQRIDESTPARPTTRYGQAKLAVCRQAERLCQALDLRFAWLRLFACYGPQDHPSWLVPYVALALLRGERPAVTAGQQRWDYLYVSDAAEAICRAVQTGDACGVFNLGSGQVETIRRIVELLRDAIDAALPVGFGEVGYRPDQVMHLEANIDRLRRATGWQPRTGLAIGLAKTVAWHRAKAWQQPVASCHHP